MAKISELPALGTIDGLETLPVLSNGVAKSASTKQLASLVAHDAGLNISASGEMIAASRRRAQMFGDAVALTDASGVVGYSMATGGRATGTYLRPGIDVTATPPGAMIELAIALTTLPALTRDLAFYFLTVTDIHGAEVGRELTSSEVVQDGKGIYWKGRYVAVAGDQVASILIQETADVVVTNDEEIRLASCNWKEVDATESNVSNRIASAIAEAGLPSYFAAPTDILVSSQNGAVTLYRDDGVADGWSMAIEPAHSGYQSYVLVRERLDLRQENAVELFEIVAKVSDPFTRALSRDIVIDQADGTNDDARIDELRFAISDGYLRWTFKRRINPGNIRLTAMLVVNADQSPLTAESLRVVSVRRRYLSNDDPLLTTGDLNRAAFRRGILADAATDALGIVPADIIVRADGSGDYPTIEAANAAIADASALNPYAIRVLPGVHAGFSGLMSTKDHVDIIGSNPRRSILYYASPTDASAATLAQSYIAYVNSRTLISGVHAIVERARYVFHPDDNNGANRNSWTGFHNAIVEHRGNRSADNGDQAVGGVAIGIGVDSGSVLSIDCCLTSGPWGGGLAAHNNIDSTRPARLVCRNSRSLAHEAGHYASVQSLGSGQADVAVFEGCVLPGPRFIINNALWLTKRADHRPANRTEWRVYGTGNTPAAAYCVDPCRALRVASADGSAASAVEMIDGGSAIACIWGQVMTSRGGVGRPADVYGTEDVSGATDGMTLGVRLGDCSTTPKSFQLSFERDAAVTIVFDADLTHKTNEEVLAIVNAQLGAAGRADLWAIARETERPFFNDEEFHPRNATSAAILRRTVLAFDGGVSKVRPMASTDPLALFAGVAMEDILAGEAGRVKGSRRAVKGPGYIALEDIWTVDVAGLGEALAYGDSFGIDPAQPGRLLRNGAGLLAVVEPADIANGFSTVHDLGAV